MLSDKLIERAKETATAQNRQPAQVLEEAVGKHLTGQRLARLADKMGAKAASMGIQEEDVPSLVAEACDEDKALAR